MIKLNILNMDKFLDTVNLCNGAVHFIRPDGTKQDIRSRVECQRELMKRYEENKGTLKVSLEVPDYRDYMSIVFFSIGDC